MRIASLLPSATEIVYQLGLGDALVAVSHDCDYPPEVKKKIQLTQIDIDPARSSSRQINDWIANKVHTGSSVYHIDQDALAKANPDLILTQELCEVCAPAFSEVQNACKVLNGERKIISLEPTSLDGILENVVTVGEATGRSKEAAETVAALRKRIDRIQTIARDVRNRPEVLCMEWFDPIFAAGHWVPEMVQLAGGVDKLGRPHRPSARIEWKEVSDYDPEVIVLMPCGFNLERTIQESKPRMDTAEWRRLKATHRRRIYATNGTAYFNRPGPRIVEGLEALAEIIHPEAFRQIAPKDSYALLSA
jgi:iron complex transport system substrate-binding protein